MTGSRVSPLYYETRCASIDVTHCCLAWADSGRLFVGVNFFSFLASLDDSSPKSESKSVAVSRLPCECAGDRGLTYFCELTVYFFCSLFILLFFLFLS